MFKEKIMKRKDIKRLAIGVVILMIVGWLGGCSADVSLGVSASEDKVFGNLQGNILNGGNIVEYGNFLLYVPNNDPTVSGKSSGIYQVLNDSGSGNDWSMEKVLELPGDYPVKSPCLTIWEDHLYLLQGGSTTSDGVIRKIDLDTGDIETIVSGEVIFQMQIRDGELYYLSGNMGEKLTEMPEVYLIRCDLDGNNSEELMEKTVLGVGGDFFFYEDSEEDSKDAVIYIAPRNFYTSENDIIVTNLETGDSGQITPDSFREKVTEYSLIQAIWPEDDFVCFSAAHTRSMDESPTDSGVYRLSETNQTIENIEDKGAASLCLQENELYTLQYMKSDRTLIPTITRTNLESMEAVTYPTTVYADDFQKLVSATEGYQYVLQVTTKGVFLVTSYQNASQAFPLYYLSPSGSDVIEVSE